MNATGVFSRQWGLFHIGSYAEAEAALRVHSDDLEAVRLRLWIALRRRDTNSIFELSEHLSRSIDPEYACIGRAYENIARTSLGMEAKPWLPPTSAWSSSELAYARASVAFADGRTSEIAAELAAAPAISAEQRVKYIQLRAWAEALAENFERQAILLLNALTRALRDDLDAGGVAQIAHPLAVLLREMELGDLARHAEALLEQVFWPIDGTVDRFYAQRALAWRASLRGEWIVSLRMLDEALVSAPDAFRSGLVLADKVRVSRVVGEDIAAESAAASAFNCFHRSVWTTSRRDEAMGIFGAMDVLASSNIDAAKALFEAAASAQVTTMIGGGHGSRLYAFKCFASSHLRNDTSALQSAHDAYVTFKRLRFVHRAASCAVRAVELRGGVRWRERAERLCSDYPRSLTAAFLAQLTSPSSKIRGRRGQVAELLVTTNKTAREIGETLGMAEATVRVHIKRIYRLVHARSRSELMRRLGHTA